MAEKLPLTRAFAGLSPATRRLLRSVAAEAEARRLPLYIVGGFVRDVLLRLPSLDIDLVVEGDAIAFGRGLVRKLGGRLLPHRAFGTAVWTLPRGSGLPDFIDLISARRESYASPGALPEVQFSTIYDDQYRRDFSINTLALRLDGPQAGELLDHWGGQADLDKGVLRVLHSESFSDDPTRILRILRLAGRLGFSIPRDTLAQLRACVPLLEVVSGERIYKELELTLLEPARAVILQTMQRYGVLDAIQPGLRFSGRMAAGLARSARPGKEWELAITLSELGFVLWLAQLPPAVASDTANRLRFPSGLAAAAVSAAQLRLAAARLAGLRPSALTERLDAEPRLAVYALYLLQRGDRLGRRLLRYAKEWRKLRAHTDGAGLLKRGLKPGPAYSRILGALRAAWLDGRVKTKKQERALLDKLLNEQR